MELWSIIDTQQKNKVMFTAVIYSRSKKEHCNLFHNHMRFLLAEWRTTAELEGAEPVGLIDAYVSGKHIYVVVEGVSLGFRF